MKTQLLQKWVRIFGAGLVLVLSQPTLSELAATDVAPGIKGPPKGQAQIVFFRRSRHADGWFATCPVSERVGTVVQARFKLGGNKFVVLPVQPGTHEYLTKTEATDRLTLEVEDGETYFVECELSIGGFASQPADLKPANLEDFAVLAPKLKRTNLK